MIFPHRLTEDDDVCGIADGFDFGLHVGFLSAASPSGSAIVMTT